LSEGSSATLVAGGSPSMPFFSPDGTWVGFFDQPAQELRRVPARGGPVEVITRVGVQLRGATWGMDDTIVYASGVTNDLRRVPARGGTPEAVTVPDAGAPHVSPSFLPDGQALLFAIGQVPSEQQVAVLSLDTGTWDLLGLRGSSPQYVASGHLVYEAEGALRAVPFDAATRRVTGEPVTVETGVQTKITGAANYAVSRAGSLGFAPAVAEQTRTLGWVDRDGDMTTTLMESHTDVAYPRLSGDARRVAYLTGFPGDVWVRDLARGSDTRVTTDGTNAYAIWADGDSVAFTSNRDGLFKMYRQPVDLSGRAELLVETELTNVTGDWSSDGRTLVYYVITPDEGRDIWALSLGEAPRPLLATPFNERAPAVSPDDRWVAYVSDQSGMDQIYLMPFPDGGRVIPVSTTGGTEPAWSSDGRELFYRAGTQMWMVPVDLASGTPGQATLLFDAMYDLDQNSVGVANYDVSPDGQHFLMVRTAAAGSPTVTLVENWFGELERLVATD
jgi:Tol biopolymer transport system component